MTIYLDHNATTPIAPEVLAAMRPHIERAFGNPSSAHRLGEEAHAAVERGRARRSRRSSGAARVRRVHPRVGCGPGGYQPLVVRTRAAVC
jgi:cysteine sulfinate desulfinase/cysteine desulfurase-like protein